MTVFILMLLSAQAVPEDTIWTQEGEGYQIELRYPEIALENADLGNLLQNYADAEIEAFKKQVSENYDPDFYSSPWAIDIRFIHESSPDDLVCVVCWNWSYTGGAHGTSMTQSFNFDLNTGETIGVVELLGGEEEFQSFAEEVIAKLLEDSGDTEWINRGASADPANYHTIFPVPDENGAIEGYTVLFPPYQVNCYACGTIEVYIPVE